MNQRKLLLEKLAKITDNPYEAVLVASRKARSINTWRLAQMAILPEDSEDRIDYRKVTTIALEHLLDGKIKYKYKD